MDQQNKKFLGVFSLALINVAAIISLRNLSFTVEYGFGAILFYLAAAIFFFIPSALVCAELATTWPEDIGVYGWVSRAFGKRIGFLAQWMNWMFSIASFPTVLTFLVGILAYLIEPSLSNNQTFMFCGILGTLWTLTALNLLGMKTSTFVSTMGALFGTLLPGGLIICLGFIWVTLGKPIQIDWNLTSSFSDFSLNQIVFFSAVVLGLAGMEMSAFYANETKNPAQTYPKAIALAAILILMLSVLGSLAMAVVVPKISIVSGMMQLFHVFFEDFQMLWAVKVVAFMALIGSFAGNNTWIIGPAKGLHHALEKSLYLPFLNKLSRSHQPVRILLVQGLIASLLTLAFFIMPSVEAAFWLVTAMTTQFAMLMYLLIFAAIIKLRFSDRSIDRPYRIPGGNLGLFVVAGSGFLTCLVSFLLGFLPPDQFIQDLSFAHLCLFEGYLILGLLCFSLPVLWLGSNQRFVL